MQERTTFHAAARPHRPEAAVDDHHAVTDGDEEPTQRELDHAVLGYEGRMRRPRVRGRTDVAQDLPGQRAVHAIEDRMDQERTDTHGRTLLTGALHTPVRAAESAPRDLS